MSAVAPVGVHTRPTWRLRVDVRALRWMLVALALAGTLAAGRWAIAPPRPRVPPAVQAPREDLAAAGFASLFARAYLSWDASAPAAHAQALAAFLAGGVDPDAGLLVPSGGAQHVAWAQVVGERTVAPQESAFTVAAATDRVGLVYLEVDVARRPGRGLTVVREPAIVGPPASTGSDLAGDATLVEVSDGSLRTVVGRALANFLDGDRVDLAADLWPGARISMPGIRLSLAALEDLRWAAGGGSVFALVRASDSQGATYTLDYELDVLHEGARWEVAAIATDPLA